MSQVWQRSPKKTSTLRPYEGSIEQLQAADLRFFRDKYEIPFLEATEFIKADPDGRYVLPIFSPNRTIRGHVLREPWPGAPRNYWGIKADTYMATYEPVQSFYMGGMGRGLLVIVEDQLSAIKAFVGMYDSVALLGKPWSKDPYGYQHADRIAELSRIARDREVIVALDADATEDSFEFVRKWGSAFKRIRVAILEKDLKDTKLEDFGEVLGV